MPGTIIKKLRMEIGWSQEAVASSLNISQEAYCKIENNQTELKVRHCKILSRIFGVNLYELIPDETWERKQQKIAEPAKRVF